MNAAGRSNNGELLIAAAERVLSETFAGRIGLDAPEPLGGGSDRSKVARCLVLEAPSNAPDSVIIKSAGSDEEHPYDPGVDQPGSPAWRLFNDWAGAQFLSQLPGDWPHSPRFLGGDRTHGFILLEDLGSGECLADLLQGADAAQAERGLLAWAETLGRMHAATAGRADEFARFRRALGAYDPNDRRSHGAAVREQCGRIGETCETLGVSLPAGLDGEIAAVAAALQEPGPFLAYTHGDPCPGNDRYRQGRLRLFDFECGMFRHALLDGVYGRVPFPTCWCVNCLPPHLPLRMEAIYRAELARGCPEAGDDERFRQAVVQACGYWAIATMGWHLPQAHRADEEWGLATTRQRVLFRLDSFAALVDERGHLPVLGATAREMAVRLRALWPPEADLMPLYPAFR